MTSPSAAKDNPYRSVSLWLTLNQQLQRFAFTRGQQQAFLEDVCMLIEDGVPAPQAIATTHEIATGSVKEVARLILDKIAEGKRIADGMEGWFPQPAVEIIRSGEEGGTLTKTMRVAAHS